MKSAPNLKQQPADLFTEAVLCAGKKRIRLLGGGRSLTLEQGKIKYETAETYTRKSERVDTEEGASQVLDCPSHAEPSELMSISDNHLFS